MLFLVNTKLPKVLACLGPRGTDFILVLKTTTECHKIFFETQINIRNSYRHSLHSIGTNRLAGMWLVANKQDLGCLPSLHHSSTPRPGANPWAPGWR